MSSSARQDTRLLLIDNYDSFTHNLCHALQIAEFSVDVRRNDESINVEEIPSRYDALCISPGPGTPADAGISMQAIKTCKDIMPLLGICLGMQAIAQLYGMKVLPSGKPVHGSTGELFHDGSGLFSGLDSPLIAARYHSLIVDGGNEDLLVDARCADGTIMSIRHQTLPVFGLQFHPESFMTEHGLEMLQRFHSTVCMHKHGLQA